MAASRGLRTNRVLLHVVATLLIGAGLLLRVVAGGALWAVLLSEMITGLGLVWFFLPLLLRLRRFVSRGRD